MLYFTHISILDFRDYCPCTSKVSNRAQSCLIGQIISASALRTPRGTISAAFPLHVHISASFLPIPSIPPFPSFPSTDCPPPTPFALPAPPRPRTGQAASPPSRTHAAHVLGISSRRTTRSSAQYRSTHLAPGRMCVRRSVSTVVAKARHVSGSHHTFGRCSFPRTNRGRSEVFIICVFPRRPSLERKPTKIRGTPTRNDWIQYLEREDTHSRVHAIGVKKRFVDKNASNCTTHTHTHTHVHTHTIS